MRHQEQAAVAAVVVVVVVVVVVERGIRFRLWGRPARVVGTNTCRIPSSAASVAGREAMAARGLS